MSELRHCPYRQATLLQQALSPDKMRIAFLLGAGCPVSISVPNNGGTAPLIPDIRGLTKIVSDKLKASETLGQNYQSLLSRLPENATIEDVLTQLRSLNEVVKSGQIDGLNKEALAALDQAICTTTSEVVGVELPAITTPYHQLAAWIRGIPRAHPIEIFTPNYDLLVEQALEAYKVPFFDGFIGSNNAFFDLSSMENDVLPSRWGRLWKVHGSINWWRTEGEEIVRRNMTAAVGEHDRQMIYPSHLKYDQSRRMPYLAMLDRLRAFLSKGQAVLITNGYSFVDQHLNEIILHGLRSNPTAICFGLLFGSKAGYLDIFNVARKHPNLSLLAEDGAILGTIEQEWRTDDQTSNYMHNLAVASPSAAGQGCKFVLGDFKHFGSFLAGQLSRFDDVLGSQNAA